MRTLFFALLLMAGLWIDDYRYRQVKQLYEKTQALDIVRRSLENQHTWRKCEINEAIYRLKKEYHLGE